VLGQERHAGEGLAARLARIALHVRVSLKVGAQVGSVRKRAGAVRAGEGLLARMCPDVTLKEPRPGEGFPTQKALTRQRVRPDVHLESSKGDVHLLAVFAAEGFLAGRLLSGAVKLLVFCEAAIGRIGLVAIRALVAGGR